MYPAIRFPTPQPFSIIACILLVLFLLPKQAITASEETPSPTTTQETIQTCLQYAKDKAASPEEKIWLLGLLQNSEGPLRAAATYAIQEIGDASPEVLDRLKTNLDHSSQDTRSVTVTALMKLGAQGQAILCERLDQTSLPLEYRIEAITALRSSLAGLRDPTLEAKMPTLHAEIERAIYPDPIVAPDSPIPQGSFEQPNSLDAWELLKENGAEGTMQWDANLHRRVGGSLQWKKTNSQGTLILRSRLPLKIRPGETVVARAYYHSDDAPSNAALQILFENKQGLRKIGNFHGGRATLAQNAIRNSPPGEWNKIVADFTADTEPQEVFLCIVLRGNPATVWLDDVAAPASVYSYKYSSPLQTLAEPETSPASETSSPSTASIQPGSPQGRARLIVDGKPVPPLLYFSYMNSFGEYAGMEALADISLQIVAVEMNSSHIHGLYPPATPVWNSAEHFDFTTPLASLEHAARNASHSRFIIVFNIYWPQDWVLKHPDQAWINAEGMKAYGNNTSALFGFGDTLPANAQWWPSPFSKEAQAAAEEGIRQFVAALKKTPWEGRVIGCHITGGHDEQFFTECFPDFSASAVAAFRQWLIKKYGNLQTLREAWNDPTLTEDTIAIPDFNQRKNQNKLFFDPLTERRYVDHRQFQAEQGMVQKIGFARAFKSAMGRPVVAMADQLGEIRSQGLDTVLEENPNSLDLIAAQPLYERRLPGYSGGIAGSLTSLNARQKIGLSELDLRTWLRAGGDEISDLQLGAALSPKDFQNIFRKEAAPMIASGNGYWLFDIGTTHWRDPFMLRTIAEGTRAYRKLELQNPTPFRPEIVIVWHDPSIYWMADTINESLSYWKRFERYTTLELQASGVPFDEIALRDLLANPDVFRYKVYIFPNAFALNKDERQAIQTLLQKDGNVLIWNYAAGYITPDGLSDSGVCTLTGIQVRSEPVASAPTVQFVSSENPLLRHLSGIPGMGELNNLLMKTGIDPYSPEVPAGFRRFIVDDPQAVPLTRYKDGNVAMAIKSFPEWTSIYTGMLGTLDPGLLNHIAQKAQAFVLTRPHVAAHFNGHFLSIHGLDNHPVPITLPQYSKIYDFDTNQHVATGTHFTIPLNAGETRWFRVEAETKTTP